MEDHSDEESMENKMEVSENGHHRCSGIDRQKTTPMYVRMYCRVGGHHRYKFLKETHSKYFIFRLFEFQGKSLPADDELIIYTWYHIV